MGGNLGCHRSIPKDPSDLCQKSRKYSAACNFSNILVSQERLNINSATEEELMTLPGVTRQVAQNIVEYREYIGGFKKVEDLALVSGVGAAKLEQVKFEICVSSKGGSSQHSPNSLRKDTEYGQHLSAARFNLNTASAAQLMNLRGLTQEMVQDIVQYRSQHGPLKSIEDLVKVESISPSLLDKIRHQFYVQRSRPSSTHTNGGLHFMAKPHPSPTSISLHSEDLDFPPGGPTQFISTRPPVELFGGEREGKPVLRVATWNLQNCSLDKASNPGVREVVCMTLLENSVKLLAVQELSDKDALEKKEEYFGFMWDVSAGIELKNVILAENMQTNGNGKHMYLQPYIAHFKVGTCDVALVNIHLFPPTVETVKHQNDTYKSATFGQTLQETLKSERDVIIMGCFSLPADASEFDSLRKEKFQNLLPPNTFTNISTKNPQGNKSLDNIWISKSLKKIFTGYSLVVREGLTNPWIPDNWSWGGVASEHCPVLAEFYMDRDCNKKEMATKANGMTAERNDTKHER
ncbi:endonuclease/exonuclease/phosphatase family domain-containing protein 1 [Xenopus tropicalis]|uniref:Endonuclease/exonuclease/phosphatase family domain-containing protein 1 n=1 Tax=Xenopus tropicalis TaxID=8364 RepID=A9JTM2_XENTR|nr:endonuclease/exonuclease/phosphatase family domain-containing protein 1 [Xenopus tropicalis]AAI55401.1 LOC100127792 protein [Xenopus tropicalis]|eukprot:NP_001106580.1 endonuclease/exonuclease/phosphatase family domain-containing protein 1 [Xenopus tropicalis]